MRRRQLSEGVEFLVHHVMLLHVDDVEGVVDVDDDNCVQATAF